MWPYNVTNFYIIKPARCTNFPILLLHETLHVSGSSSAHHQEFIQCTLGTGKCHTSLQTDFEQKQPDALISQFYSGMKLYMFRAVPLPIIRSLFSVHSALVSHRFVDSFRARPGWSCLKAVYKPVWHLPVPSVHWINSWWWAEELTEACRVSRRSKFGKLIHLVGSARKLSTNLYDTYQCRV